MNNQTRRSFVRNASLGAAGIGLTSFSQSGYPDKKEEVSKSREVWIATLTQHQIGGKSCKESVEAAIKPVSYTHLTLPTIYSV